MDDQNTTNDGYSRKVGERLRAIRRQKRLSLQEVEANSEQEFKASVLGAYERGERAISVPRLRKLAAFYNVPVDQLLPIEGAPDFGVEVDEVIVTQRVVQHIVDEFLDRLGVQRPGPAPARCNDHACAARQCNGADSLHDPNICER